MIIVWLAQIMHLGLFGAEHEVSRVLHMESHGEIVQKLEYLRIE
jgi:hypothetical protein